MSAAHTALSLFISYSHKDDALRARLETHLALLKRQHVFSVWTDRRISAGNEWAGAIDQALETARVIVLLVSADFLASDYCYDRELARAMERHEARSARVVPIIVRACDWQSAIFGKLQALPRNGVPIDRHPDGEEAAFTQVAQALRAIADELRTAPSPTPPPGIHGQTAAPSTTPSANQAAQDHQGAPPLTDAKSSPHGATEQPTGKAKHTLKISALKFLGLEIGPVEFDWPPHVGTGVVRRAFAACAIVALVACGIYYQFVIRPAIAAARDSMRTAMYAAAQVHLEVFPQWLAWWPQRQALLAQARFGVRLAQGENIQDLEPELARLRARHPQAPDVAIFDGLLAYWKADISGALTHFAHARALDPQHVEAYFLAAGRHTELARALVTTNDTAARKHVSEARTLIDLAAQASPNLVAHKKYANQRVEILTLQGDFEDAYRAYRDLSHRDVLSAVLAAVMSWHVPHSTKELRDGMEAARLMGEKVDAAEGWKFDIGSSTGDAEVAFLDDLVDKRCFAAWVVQISKSIIAVQDAQLPAKDGAAPHVAEAAPAPVQGPPASCENAVKPEVLHDVVCSKLLSALQALPDTDRSKGVLRATWSQMRPQCNPDIRAAPVLRPLVRQESKREAAPTRTPVAALVLQRIHIKPPP